MNAIIAGRNYLYELLIVGAQGFFMANCDTFSLQRKSAFKKKLGSGIQKTHWTDLNFYALRVLTNPTKCRTNGTKDVK